jgi:hypothetical protein
MGPEVGDHVITRRREMGDERSLQGKAGVIGREDDSHRSIDSLGVVTGRGARRPSRCISSF